MFLIQNPVGEVVLYGDRGSDWSLGRREWRDPPAAAQKVARLGFQVVPEQIAVHRDWREFLSQEMTEAELAALLATSGLVATVEETAAYRAWLAASWRGDSNPAETARHCAAVTDPLARILAGDFWPTPATWRRFGPGDTYRVCRAVVAHFGASHLPATVRGPVKYRFAPLGQLAWGEAHLLADRGLAAVMFGNPV